MVPKYNREKKFYFNRLTISLDLSATHWPKSILGLQHYHKSTKKSGSLFSKYSTLILAAPITVPVPAQGVSHSPNHASLNNFEIKPKSNSLILFTSTIIYTWTIESVCFLVRLLLLLQQSFSYIATSCKAIIIIIIMNDILAWMSTTERFHCIAY